MGPKLRERLANIAGMALSELQQLRLDLVAAFDLLDDNGGSLDDLNEIAEAIDNVKAEETRHQSAQELRDRVHMSEQTPEVNTPAEDDEDDDEEQTEEPVAESGGEAEYQEAEAPEANRPQANRPSLSQVAAATGGRNAPVASSSNRVSTRLVAGGDVSGFSVGQEIATQAQLSQAIQRRLESLGRGGAGDKVHVASLIKEYPVERQLGEDPYLNDEKIARVMEQGMVASGGICEPLAVDYAISTIGSTDRPLHNGLPSYNATRGGVKFTVPPTLGDVVGVPETWTLADDVAATPPATTPRKACFRITCETPEEAVVYAIPVCLEVGNFMARFTPEVITAQTALLDVAAARMAELTLLDGIDAVSTAVTSTSELGTVRTILPTLDRLNAAYRYRYRLGDSTVRMVLPGWVKEEVRADLAMELAHDNPPFNVSDAQINAYFTTRHASPIWMLEDKAGTMGADQAAGAIIDFPSSFVAYYFAEGTFQLLDGGRIDLGVVRDSELNSRNDYQIWREDFEGIAKRGNESLKVTITTAPTGMSAGTKDTSVVAGP
jgi:hypothetical protein